MSLIPANTLTEAIAGIEGVSSRIEDVFARVGHELGRGHLIFKELNQGLAALSAELSGAEIEGAATALQEIAARLSELAQALPAETALLETIGKSTAEASALLKPLFKHIQMITIIARSARIEAASLDGDREGFLAFTQEAYDLGKAVQGAIEGCARDQQRLSEAVATASGRQKEFEGRYRNQLAAESAELGSAYAELRDQRGNSSHLADLASASTRKIAEAVGSAIISLQAGDSTRQRLEHVAHGLSLVSGPAPSLVPEPVASEDGARTICQLQAAQLRDAQREFGGDIGQIVRALTAILHDAGSVVGHGRTLFGGEDGGASSFLARIKQTLAHASTLITTCEGAGRSVDEALAIVEDTLTKFRQAIAGLAEATVDITLIGMNAGLKASHLGSRGSAFVVIANELKATSDQVSLGAGRLRPVLDGIERSARELKQLRVQGDTTQLTQLEPQILQALREVEAGNERLGKLMSRLVDEGAEFERLINSAQGLMSTLGEGSAALPAVAARLETASAGGQKPRPQAQDEATLDALFARYTMERERDVHRQFLQTLGLTSVATACRAEAVEAADDGIELF
ncbi:MULTISPECIES: chemotaxis protein [Bradyrhizobium]|uniref:chemotaxis protein n=1 Tax=Bradyrhizobium TaxID=374 RepID=UPI00155F2B8D|nr:MULTISPECIES: chemotaxis protein [Bradyrhizobium]MDD1519165.1 chemotaxis protein [Bradyrhizobium sp. WBAH30]MDD1543409.1 chemotaxis protein [Bradyrhizobium sp. WBAH41]MDD1557539.1 chemotaxis protein [Bradyrhizobium sp. WBAH23]MDD1564951.1 chemotaxis protein [Bradyrhizobium sp. WBAH33]MDD1590359.1 chemotaxis protein [Bradyrhizobium sp. WBAH42]